MFGSKVRSRTLIGLATVVVVAGGSAAFAASKDESTLSACVHHGGGGLYVAKGGCNKGDARWTWSQTGPRGATGARGAAGAHGATGAAGSQGSPGSTATTANDSNDLGGQPASAYQRTVTGTCANNSAVTSVSQNGTVGCSNVQFLSGRVTMSYYASTPTLLTIPGVVSLIAEQCYSGAARAQLQHLSNASVDLWYPGSTTDDSFENGNWGYVLTPTTVPSGTTYHLGVGTGSGAKVITITESQTQDTTAQTCTFQATAEIDTVS